jgi:hypothetical protein
LLLILALVGGPAAARDRGADGDFDRRESSHFVLFQDVDIDRAGGWHGSVQFERDVLDSLELGHDRLSAILDLRPPRKIQVWVYDPEIFDATYGGLFRFRVAGFFGDAIHVRGDTVVTTQLSRTLHHELVHAAFDAAAPSLVLPAWLNEGVAEWFESRTHGKRSLSASERAYLQHALRGGYWIPIGALGSRNLGRLQGDAAGLAYLQSYAMVDYLVRKGGDAKLDRLVATMIRMRSVDGALRRIYRLTPAELDGALRAELE